MSDFPVALLLSTSAGTNDEDLTAIFTEIADADRKKIAVTTSDGTTQCYVEIEKWDSTNKKAALHVKIPSISSSSNTELYLYYDSGHADNTTYVGDTGDSPAQNVWDSNFEGVWHLAQDPSGGSGAIKDSTSNNVNATSSGSMTSDDLVDALVCKGLDLDGSDDYIKTSGLSFNPSNSATIEICFKETTLAGTVDRLLLQQQDGTGTGRTIIGIEEHDDATNPDKIYCNLAGTILYGSQLSAGSFYHAAVTHDGSNAVEIFLNGSSDTTDTRTVEAASGEMLFGIGKDELTYPFDGIIDEVRISQTQRSDAWIKATYHTLFDSLGAWK